MGQEETGKIKEFFFNSGIKPIYLEHEAVTTSEDAAKIRGTELRQGIKAILFTDGHDWVIVNIPADKKVDAKKVAEYLGWQRSKMRMATPEEVMQKTGCEIGAVPPLCHKEFIPVLVDAGVYDNPESSFNIGLRTQSVRIKTELMKEVFQKIGAKEGGFSK